VVLDAQAVGRARVADGVRLLPPLALRHARAAREVALAPNVGAGAAMADLDRGVAARVDVTDFNA
jgi:hypothetical protein